MSDPERGDKNDRSVRMAKSSRAADLGSSILPLIFAAIGLALTYNDKYRGNRQYFINAFCVVIGVSAVELVLGFVVCCCCFRAVCGGRGICSISFANWLSSIASIVGSVVGLALLAIALIDAHNAEGTVEAGCIRGFGCANILAIVTTAFYCARVIVIILLILCCCLCCKRR